MPTTIHERIEGLGFSDASIRAITGLRTLVRHKYAIVDGPREWADSCNPSDDSMERMENMMVPLTSPVIAGRYRRDFDHLWSSGPVEASGNFATAPQVLFYEGFRAPTDVDLSPGPG